MEMITELLKLESSPLIIGFFILLSAVIAMYEIIGKFSKIIGKPVKWVKEKEKDHELLRQTADSLLSLEEKHVSLTEMVNGITNTLAEMQKKENDTKLKELKDSLIRYYNKYKQSGEWSKLEKDAFWDLFEDYEKRGGDGYIHTIVEPVMREMKEID